METHLPPDGSRRRPSPRRSDGPDVLGDPTDATARREARIGRLVRELGVPVLPREVDARLRHRLRAERATDAPAPDGSPSDRSDRH